MNLYNELVEVLINILFSDSSGVVQITQWQEQVVELIALPICLILVFCLVGLLWKCITWPFYFFDFHK